MNFRKQQRFSKIYGSKFIIFSAFLIVYVGISTPSKPRKVFVLGLPTLEGLGAKYAFARTALNPIFRAGFDAWSLSWTESKLHTAQIADAFGSYSPGFEITGFSCFVTIPNPLPWNVDDVQKQRITAASLQLHRLLGCNSLVVPSIPGTPGQIAQDSETLNSALKCPYPPVKDPFLTGYHWRRGDVRPDAQNEQERERYVPWTQVQSDIDDILLKDQKNSVYIITEGTLKFRSNWTGRVKLDNRNNIREVMCNARRFSQVFAQFGNFGYMLQAASSYKPRKQEFNTNIASNEYTLEMAVLLIYVIYCWACRHSLKKTGTYYFFYNHFTSKILFTYRVTSLLTLTYIPQSKNMLWIPTILTRGVGKLNFLECTNPIYSFFGEYKFGICDQGYGIGVSNSDMLFGPVSLVDILDVSFSYMFGTLWRAGFLITSTDFILLCISYWKTDFSLLSGTIIHWMYAFFSSVNYWEIPIKFLQALHLDRKSEKVLENK